VATDENQLEDTGLYGTFSFNNSGTEYSGTINAVKTTDINKAVTEQEKDDLKSVNTPRDIDLVYASATAKGEDHIGDTNDAVSLSFDHLLSRVAFQFTNGFSNNNTKLAIKNIVVYDVATSAKVTIPTKAWSDHSTTLQNLLFGDVEKIVTSAAATTATNKNKAEAGDGNTYTEVKAYGTSENYYLIPYTDAAKAYLVTLDIERLTKLPAVTMEAGKSYLYTLYLDPTTIGLNEITFKVEVNDWGKYEADGSTNEVSGYTKPSDSSNSSSSEGGDGNDQQ
jgi:hypothetical protein